MRRYVCRSMCDSIIVFNNPKARKLKGFPSIHSMLLVICIMVKL